jgi:hypothetical protein
MNFVHLLVALALGGCAWVTPEDVARRAPELDDDADGIPKARDCNDNDPTVAPTFPETWYNGVDNDCRGDDDYDQDLDGFVADEHVGKATAGAEGSGALPGGDCDDSPVRPVTDDADSTLPFGPRVSPRQPDTWYDGVDQDCSGNDDYDQDGDGYVPDDFEGLTTRYVDPSGALPAGDCDDDDVEIHAGQDEVWYDGIDRNCDGLDDYDRDADGWVPADVAYRPTVGAPGTGNLEVGDCDDAAASVHPGATDAWYDGTDANCRGDDDYDRDLDGHRPAEGGGLDCDDTAAAVFPGAPERLGDTVDGDCDGGDDDVAVDALEGYTIEDVRRMEFLATSRRVYLSVAAGRVETANSSLFDSAVAWTWYPTNLRGPAVAFIPWYAASSVDDPDHALSTAAIAAVSVVSGTGYADMLYGAFGIEDLAPDGGASQVRFHRYDVERSTSRGGPVSTVAFDDLGLSVEGSGRMHVLACDREGAAGDAVGTLHWLRWMPAVDIVPTVRALASGTGDGAVEACAMRLDTDNNAHALTASPDGVATANFDPGGATWSLSAPTHVVGRRLREPKFPEGFLTGTVMGVDADAHTVVIADPFNQDAGLIEVGEDVVHADAWQEGVTDFTVYVAWVDASGEAWLARSAASGSQFTLSRIETPFVPSWVAIHGNGDQLLIAVAGEGQLAVETVDR